MVESVPAASMTLMITTMKNKTLVGATILMLAATSALAQQASSNRPGDLYRANELSLDGYGTASLNKYSIENISGRRVRHNTRLGLGAGINYFFTKFVGIGADAYSENTSGAMVDSASGNLTLRLPLEGCGLAPYIYGGGGRQFDLNRVSFAQVGGGLEYRFTPQIGVFVDARWVLPEHTRYYGVARLGVRYAF